jgi:predicted Zn-dependent protease
MASSLFPHDLRRAMIATSFPVLIGLDPRLPQEVAHRLPRRTTPVASMVRAQFALVRGNAAAARAVLASARRDTSAAAPIPRALLEATEGWVMLVEGDTTVGLARLAGALSRPGVMWADAPTLPIRLQWALAQAARPETRAEGIRRLRHGFTFDPQVLPLTLYALGQAYEADGDRPRAAESYREFLRLWDRADPQLQPLVQRARAALTDETGQSR